MRLPPEAARANPFRTFAPLPKSHGRTVLGAPRGRQVFSSTEALDAELHYVWSLVSHLHSVQSIDAWRAVYQEFLPKITRAFYEMGQNAALYAVFQKAPTMPMSEAQKQAVQNQLRDFKLSGIDLSPEKKQRFLEIQTELSPVLQPLKSTLVDCTDA